MIKKIETPNIPMPRNAVIAINVNFKKKKEHIVIGDFDEVNAFIRSRENVKIIFEETRPLGSFLLDIITEPIYFAEVKANFCQTSKEKLAQNLGVVEGLYESDNPVLKYMGLNLWREYAKFLKAKKEKDKYYPVLERIEDLILPFMYNIINEILNWQRHKPYNPLLDMPSEYYKYPLQSMLIPDAKGTKEYVFSDFTLLSLIVYYLKIIYEKKKYFSYCKVCGNLFLAPDTNKTSICSDKCKKKQQKLNKQKYDEVHKDNYAEKLHKSEYQYWFNRLAKAKRKTHRKAIADIEENFAKFKEFSVIKKNQVNDGLLTHDAYYAWCLEQRGVIDEIMMKHDLFERG